MSPAVALVVSVFALAAGPLVAGLLHRQARLHALLDGFVLVMVAGLAVLHLMPHAYEVLGPIAIALGVAGIMLPYLVERRFHGHSTSESRSFLLLAMGGLILHASLDGATLAASAAEFAGHGASGPGAHAAEDGRLGVILAVILHRLPVGLLVWWSVLPTVGRRTAIALLAGVGVSTVGGFALSNQLLPLGGGLPSGALHALLAGGLLHVVLDHHHHDRHCDERHHSYAALGACVAVAIFVVLPQAAPVVFTRAGEISRRLILESSFAIVLGFLGAGLLTMVPARSLARAMTGGNSLSSALRGIVFGLPLPICSCGVVPLYRSLHRRGVPAAAAMAFLIATPELGVDAVIISIPLLGVRLTVIRLVAAALVAIVAGLVAGWLGDRERTVAPPTELGRNEKGNSLGGALRFGLLESVDDLGPWIFAGIVIAGFVEPVLARGLLDSVPAIAQVPLLGALATPLYICASGATPVAAVFLAKGVSAGAVVAFLLTGPATNVTTFGAIRGAHRLGVTIALVVTVPLASMILGLIIELSGITGDVAPLAEEAHPGGALQWAGVGIFALLLLMSLFRQGPRGFLRQLGIGHDERAVHAATPEPDASAGSRHPSPSAAS